MKYDIRNKRFGKWLVLDEEPIYKNENNFWWCQCDCGSEKRLVKAGSLLQGKSKSCGCGKFNDLTGKRFGKLTVVKLGEPYIDKHNNKITIWNCVCDCSPNNIISVKHGNLQSGNTQSCGCEKGKYIVDDLTGLVFGRWKVLKRIPNRKTSSGNQKVMWLCECTCQEHNLSEVDTYSLLNGHSQSCGCLAKELISLRNKKYNKYELFNTYGIGYTSNTSAIFYFDIKDFNKIKNICWYEDNNGYIVNRSNSETILLHRIIMDCQDGEIVDHKNRNKKDNRKSNLRLCDFYGNARNASLATNNLSGIIGVNYDERLEKWIAKICVDYNQIVLGYFDNIEDATIERLKAEKRYFGDYAPQRHLYNEHDINL